MAVKVCRSVKSERIWRFFCFLRLQSRQRLLQTVGDGTLAAYVQMAVDVRSHLDVRVAQPLLHVFQAVALRQQHAGRSAATACGERLPKKFASLGFGRRATPAQKTLVVQKLRQKHALSILLSIAQLPRATFYYHLKQMQKEDKYASVKEEITTIYHENRGRYGYRRITAELVGWQEF